MGDSVRLLVALPMDWATARAWSICPFWLVVCGGWLNEVRVLVVSEAPA